MKIVTVPVLDLSESYSERSVIKHPKPRENQSVQPDRKSSDQKEKRDAKTNNKLGSNKLGDQQNYGETMGSSDVIAPIDELVEEFSMDPQAQAAGVKAEVEGSGPGLKVVLRDESGQFIRRFSQQEFSRIHDSSTHEGGPRGKILDQKS